MSQDNSVLPVPFHGAILTLIDHEGTPFVALRPIVEAMGMSWASQTVKINADKARWGVSILETPADPQPMLCLPLRKLGAWLMTIHANKVRADLRDRVRAYQAECDDALWSYWTQGQATRVPTAQIPTEPAAALPPPLDPLDDPAVRSAIASRAHAISLRHYERLVADLTEAVRQHAERCPDDTDLAHFIAQIDTPDGALVLIHRADLWHICAVVASMSTLHEHVMTCIHKLEATTGRTWYGGQRDTTVTGGAV